tara:strand:+ start:5999 stop:6952 length:954 start_codon:yes stop_codon:yes gene_type:complete
MTAFFIFITIKPPLSFNEASYPMKSTIATLSRAFPIFLLGLCALTPAHANQISTTRLKSTAGTGVASLLMDEATFLNPASISFFQVSSIYLQKSGTDISPADTSPLAPSSEEQLLFVASDAKGDVDGSISYAKEQDRFGKLSRLAASMSAPVGKKSTLGFSYATTSRKEGPLKGKLKQITAGVNHALSPEFTLGLVVPDILAADPYARRAIIGGQYIYKDFVSLMFDAGSDWERDAKDSSLVRAAIQLKVLEDFYMRFGAQEDRGMKLKGTGAGIGWVQPRLVIDVSMSTTEYKADSELNQNDEKAKETSFSLSYRF